MIAAAMLALGLAGCTIEHEVEQPGESGKQIVFTPSVEKGAVESRAATGHPVGETATVIPDGGSFGMYAYHSPLGTGADLALFPSLANQKVTFEGPGFTYSPVVNWPVPPTSKLAFFGYYPWIAQTGTPNPAVTMDPDNRKMEIDYTVPASPAQHIDLMYTRKGLTAGYDAVPIVFGHALTWLKFSAKAINYIEDVKITKITVKNARTNGKLTVLETGTPAWALTNDKANYEITSAGGGLTSTALTGTMTAVNTSAGHMLVLPQVVAGLVVEVEATLGGVAFPEPFVCKLDGSANWEMNRIVTYQIVLTGDEMTVTTKVDDWTTKNVNVIYDGQWFLSVTKDEIELDGTASSDQIVAETNYNTTQFGYPVGLQYSAAEIVYGGSTSDWLTVSGGNNGDLSRTLTFAAQANTLYEERTAEVKIKAGNLTKVIYVTQAQKLPELTTVERFAKSNIVMYTNGTKKVLTFAESQDDHTTSKSVDGLTVPPIPSNAQGLHFRWGSLVGVTSDGATGTVFNGSNSGAPPAHVVFWPQGYTAAPTGSNTWTFSDAPTASQVAVPYATSTDIPANPNSDVAGHDLDGFLNWGTDGKGFDAANAKGDICRYISEMGWVKDRWRMPTTAELTELFGEHNHAANWGAATITGTGTDGKYGYFPIPAARFLGDEVNGSTNVDNYPAAAVVMPAPGRRLNSDGSLSYTGTNGFYWSSTPTADPTTAYYLRDNSNGHTENNTEVRTFGYSVRCIRMKNDE